jgi:dodecin
VTAYYEKIEIVGLSSKSYEDAIARAVSEVRKSYKELRWFEIVEFRGGINDDGSIQYQVAIKVAAKKG